MHRFFLRDLFLGCYMLCSGISAFALLAAPPAPDYPVLDFGGEAGGTPSARAWTPMGDTAPVSALSVGGRAVLRMPCDFSGSTRERAAWDLDVNLDLSTKRGLRFQFYCVDPAPISGFTFYLKSGKGWYYTGFSAETPSQWQSVSIDKVDTLAEGAPSGWSGIDRIRIAAWLGDHQDSEFFIAGLGFFAADSSIALILGEAAARETPSEAATIGSTAWLVRNMLDQAGVPFIPISDLDLNAARLAKKSLAILPYNPTVPDPGSRALAGFVRNGGKLLTFYQLPSALQPLVGLKEGSHIPQRRPGYFASICRAGDALAGMPERVAQASWNIKEMHPIEGRARIAAYWYDDQGQSTGNAALLVSDSGIHMTHILLRDDLVNKRLLLLAMAGHFLPECWRQSAQWHLESAGAVGPYASFDVARTAILGAPAAPGAGQFLERAAARRAAVQELIQASRYPEAIAAANEVHECMLDAYCCAQRAAPGERRMFWCHDAFGVAGLTWDDAARLLAENGFTDLLTNQAWGGVAYYTSEVLPVSSEIEKRGDQLGTCLAACKKYGIACHVWKVNWNMSGRTPEAFRAKMASEGRTQVQRSGASKPDWLCPSNPLNQQLEIDAMVEIAAKYEVTGIHFDYIRYSDRDSCFCAGCRKRFEDRLGKPVAGWPSDVLTQGALRQSWLDFRRDQITRVVAAVSEAARKIRPDIVISAAVFPNWPADRDTLGQDWKLWCDRGYLDFVCPMDYTPHTVKFEAMAKQQLSWAGKVPCYPGIGLSVWPRGDSIINLIEQIEVTRRLQTGGFSIFNYGPAEAAVIVPRCGLGITKR